MRTRLDYEALKKSSDRWGSRATAWLVAIAIADAIALIAEFVAPAIASDRITAATWIAGSVQLAAILVFVGLAIADVAAHRAAGALGEVTDLLLLDRRLDLATRPIVVGMLRQKAGSIAFGTVGTTKPEIVRYRDSLRALFDDAEWTILQGFNIDVYGGGIVEGVSLSWDDALQDDSETVRSALIEAGVPVSDGRCRYPGHTGSAFLWSSARSTPSSAAGCVECRQRGKPRTMGEVSEQQGKERTRGWWRWPSKGTIAFALAALLVAALTYVAIRTGVSGDDRSHLIHGTFALASGGFASAFTGFLRIRWGKGLQAGGGIAVFIVALYWDPPIHSAAAAIPAVTAPIADAAVMEHHELAAPVPTPTPAPAPPVDAAAVAHHEVPVAPLVTGPAVVSRATGSTPTLDDGQLEVVINKMKALGHHVVYMILVGQSPTARVTFERLRDHLIAVGWNVPGAIWGMDPTLPTTSFITAGNIGDPLVQRVFSIFSDAGVDLPLRPFPEIMKGVHDQAPEAELVILIQ